MSRSQSFLNALALFLAIYQIQSKDSRLVLQKKLLKKINDSIFQW